MTNRLSLSVAALVLLFGSTVFAADKKKPVPEDNYQELYSRYLEAARHQPTATAGDSASWMNSLMLDNRARHLNDLITVRVIESISGSGTADASLSKSGSAAVATPGLFGLDKKIANVADPANLVGVKHDTAFKGAGATTRASDLTATMGARVSEVLPNGDLVIEGVRELDINGERQIVVLTGVARVADIAPGNVILSTTLGQLSIKYFGSGLMKDSLSPGWLIRVLNKIF
jgi:flagellar L-ring protein precursor FlgH